MRLIIILSFLIGKISWARPTPQGQNQLNFCLGQEEKKLHLKKDVGPIYDLNQKLINEVIQLMGTDARPEYLNQICQSVSPSLAFLELMLFEPNTWWQVNPETEKAHSSLSLQLIKEFNDQAFDLFLQFVQRLQMSASHPQCVNRKVPELRQIYQQLEYLQEELNPEELVPEKTLLKKLFQKIMNWEKILKQCQLEAKAQKLRSK